jgi:hypothetical protein
MCKEFFPADVYTIRMIIDDRNNDECVKFLPMFIEPPKSMMLSVLKKILFV